MTPRRYRADRRAQTTDATRRRIVEATAALHAEQGIAATSMKQIAARAGVGVGTVYHHFPSYDDAILACGQHTLDTAPPPGPEIFDGARTVPERLRCLARAVFAWYARVAAFERVRCDQHLLPVLHRFVAEEEQRRLALAREALRPARMTEDRAAVAAALLDVAVLRALARAGFTTEDAADEVARVIAAALPGAPFR
ncbi:TetR/AcrR family transcriptional regulator [Elioraea sp.]|uniref:TetR/AcrR family transcriptional regulator n=1 Tax=Elioraea sp. TaxID=2185103 RepID=UPI003F71047D